MIDLADVLRAGHDQASLFAHLPSYGCDRRLASFDAAARWCQVDLTVVPTGLAASSLFRYKQLSVPLDQGSYPESHVGHRHSVPNRLGFEPQGQMTTVVREPFAGSWVEFLG